MELENEKTESPNENENKNKNFDEFQQFILRQAEVKTQNDMKAWKRIISEKQLKQFTFKAWVRKSLLLLLYLLYQAGLFPDFKTRRPALPEHIIFTKWLVTWSFCHHLVNRLLVANFHPTGPGCSKAG